MKLFSLIRCALTLLKLCIIYAEASAIPESYYSPSDSNLCAIMEYHGGPIIHKPTQVHLIFYGERSNWNDSVIRMFENVVKNLNHSGDSEQPSLKDWWRTCANYGDSLGKKVSESISLGSVVFSETTTETLVRIGDIEDILMSLLTTKQLPTAEGNLFVFFVGENTTVSRNPFNDPIHRWFPFSAKRITFGLVRVKEPPSFFSERYPIDSSPLASSVESEVSFGLALNSLLHVLAGMVTNPYGNGWYFKGGVSSTNPLWLDLSMSCGNQFGLIHEENGKQWNFQGFDGKKFLVDGLCDSISKLCVQYQRERKVNPLDLDH